MKKRTLLKSALAIALMAALPNLVSAQWQVNGNGVPAIGPNSFLGTINGVNPIRFGTQTGGAAIGLGQRMVINTGGNVGIGQHSFVPTIVAPTDPQNKLLVENGNIYAPASPNGNVYNRLLTRLSPLVPTLAQTDMAIISYSNNDFPGANNIGMVAFCENDGQSAAIGIGTISASRLAQDNIGVTASGADGQRNAGLLVDASVDPLLPTTILNSQNVSIKATARGEDNADNLGMELDVTGRVSANSNVGFDIDIDGDNAASFNEGIILNINGNNAGYNTGTNVNVSGTSTGNNQGGVFDVTGTTPGNLGVVTHVSGDATYITGVRSIVSGGSSTNLVSGVDVDADATGLPSSVGVDANAFGGNTNNLGGHFKAQDGNFAVGVIGEITNNNAPTNYGVYGDYATGGPSTPPTGGTTSTNFAGYFNGDVFCATTYYYSDPKLKENIAEYKGALEQLSKIDIKRYNYRNREYPDMNMPQGDQIGLLSTNLKEVFPGLVKPALYPGSLKGKADVAFDAVNINALVPVLVQAVKELDAKNVTTDELKKEVAALLADKAKTVKELEAVKTDNESLKKDIADVKEMLDKICSNGCGDFKPASTLGGTTGSESNLFQNVPNPFSNTTVIPYTIGQGVKQAVLTVTDLNGTELKRFSTSQAGSGTFEVNMGDLGTGTYIYSLFTDGKLIDTKKMVLAGK